ncbi:uncharacterized protein PV07_10842 [Cladophialophora immunda]|uniref:Enoyl reductase (ER) domain-containing protein n=1 Tax=Cladophialophora immunda TaxID=569365 RepID=A0A0D2C1J8_9EURO|nr:uncharacterized protein PV07_10842 [Cladophialophora immunda]KIW25183.1 hypothetical protein PV07_10842 [Cladophialophora immunda]
MQNNIEYAEGRLPSYTKGWIVRSGANINENFDSLEWQEAIPIPDLGHHDILVKFHAASLNYRDLMVAKGQYKFGTRENVVPGSDGAGQVVCVGKYVTYFQPGDKVVTVFNQKEPVGSTRAATLGTSFGLGGLHDGTLRQYGVFNEEGLMDIPSNLSLTEAATLSCAALTAWNALYGLQPLQPGQVVLTQGTGGVSIFALQFSLAAGAMVIATTSSPEKCSLLKRLGAHHTINYKEDPAWGATARSLTPAGQGVDCIVEVGGAATMQQSLNSVRRGGHIEIVGYLGRHFNQEPVLMEAFRRLCTVRGVAVGTRQQFSNMLRAIQTNNIKPLIDRKVFRLEDAKSAYEYAWNMGHKA